MELKKYKLGELIDVTRGQSLSGEYYATEGKYIRLTCGNFDYNNNCFKENTSKDNLFFTGTIKPEFIMEKGDIITPLTEQAIGLLGSTAIIPESDKYIQSQDVAKIICKEDKLDHGFAYYLISSKLVKEQLSVAAQQTKIRHTSPDKIKDCTVWIPDMENQRRIAHVLFTLDRKISLNRSINAELERMAKEIYDYWFVQFEFPDANGRPYKSSGGAMVYNPVLKREVPEGWEVKKVKNVVTHINTGLNPRDNFKLGGGDIKYITVKNLTLEGNIDFSSCDTIDEEALAKVHNRSNIQKGDILFASISPLGRCFYIDQEPNGWDINESVFAIRPNADEISGKYLYLFLKSQEFVKKAEKSATGSIFLGIRMETLKGIDILLPANDVIKEFDKAMNNIIGKQHQNFDENEHLTKLRDELLPLLMTGQVKILEQERTF